MSVMVNGNERGRNGGAEDVDDGRVVHHEHLGDLVVGLIVCRFDRHPCPIADQPAGCSVVGRGLGCKVDNAAVAAGHLSCIAAESAERGGVGYRKG